MVIEDDFFKRKGTSETLFESSVILILVNLFNLLVIQNVNFSFEHTEYSVVASNINQ